MLRKLAGTSKRRHRVLLACLVLAVAGASGYWQLFRDGSSAASPTLTATVSTETVKETVAAAGTVAPARTADLDFEVAGTVTGVLVEEGERVRKGQALAMVGTSALVASRKAEGADAANGLARCSP